MTTTQEGSVGALSDLKPIQLAKPALAGGDLLAAAFRLRRTEREFSAKPLPPQVLSDLLWAACGINRKRGPFGVSGRTAASASNSQEVEVYAALKEGTHLYDPRRHQLTPVVAGDLRRLALGARLGEAGADAPLRPAFVADVDKLEHTSGFRRAGAARPGGPTLLLLRGHGPHRGQRVSVRRLARTGRLVSQLRSCGAFGEAQPRRSAPAPICPDGRISARRRKRGAG